MAFDTLSGLRTSVLATAKPSINRRCLLRAVATIGLLATLPSQARAETYELTQAGFRVLYMAPVFVAMDKGLFEKRGVKLTFQEIDSGALGPAAVLSGEAQISDLDPKGIAELKSKGRNPLMFYNLVDRVTLDLIVRTEVVEKLSLTPDMPVSERAKALKGMTIGITRPGAPTDVYPRYFLAKAGLDPTTDANIVQIGGVPALEAALRSGRIDGFFLSPPLPQKLELEGVGKIVIRNTAGEVPELSGTSYDSLFTTAEYAAANGPALRAYAQGIQDAVKWINDNREEAIDFLAEKWFSDTNKETLKISLDVLMPSVSATGMYNADSVQKYLEISHVLGQPVEADTTEGVFWTNEFVKPR